MQFDADGPIDEGSGLPIVDLDAAIAALQRVGEALG